MDEGHDKGPECGDHCTYTTTMVDAMVVTMAVMVMVRIMVLTGRGMMVVIKVPGLQYCPSCESDGSQEDVRSPDGGPRYHHDD